MVGAERASLARSAAMSERANQVMDTRTNDPDVAEATSGNGEGARREPGILRWVIISVGGTFLGLFLLVNGLVLTGTVELGHSKFVDLAREKYIGFLVWKGLMLLLKGYGLLSVVYVIVCFPLVFLWVRKRAKRITRWAVIWRTVSLVLLSLLLMILRLFWKQPYFSSEGWVVEPLMDFIKAMPEAVRWVVLGLLFDVLPWLIAIVVIGFYGVAFHRSTSRLRPRPRRIVFAGMGVAFAGVAVAFS